MRRSLIFTMIMVCFGLSTALAQQNYFYGTFKTGAETIGNSIIEDEENPQYDNGPFGIIVDLGYGITLNRYFSLEAGGEVFAYRPETSYFDYNIGREFYADQLAVRHTALSFQLRPVFNVDIDDDIFLRFALGFNYQKLYSSGLYESYQESDDQYVFKEKFKTRSGTDFNLNLQPSAGIMFRLSDRWAVGLDFSYVNVDWNRDRNYLHFEQIPDLEIADDKTSTVYAGFKVQFR